MFDLIRTFSKMFWCFEYKKAKIIIDVWIENGDETAVLNLHGLKIEKLPKLPVNLQKLYCSGCPIKELPELPESLQQLYCFNCPNLKELPKLPESLQVLDCYHCNIKKLPELPIKLQDLYCYKCPIELLPTILPAKVYL